MKKINLFKWMVALMMLPMGARAQVGNVYPTVQPMKSGMIESTILDQQNYRKIENGSMTTLLYNKPIAKKESTDDEVQVHFILQYDKEAVEVLHLMMYLNQQNYGAYWGDEGDDFTMSLPKGEWDFCLSIYNSKTFRLEHIIQDLVQIDGDMTLTFSEEDATNHIAIKELMPNGEEMKFTTYRGSESGEVEVVSRGDADVLKFVRYAVYKPEGPMGLFYKEYGDAYNFEGFPFVKDFGWWVSPSKSGRFAFCRDEYAAVGSLYEYGKRQGSTFYVNKFYTDKTETAVLSNNPADYFYTEEEFVQSKGGKQWSDQRYPTGVFGMTLAQVIDDIYVGSIYFMSAFWKDEANTLHIYNGVSVGNDASESRYNLLATSRFIDNWQATAWGDAQERIIHGMPAYRKDGKPTYVNCGPSNGISLFCALPNSNCLNSMRGNPAFSYSPEQKALPYGSSCPVLTMDKYSYEAEWGHLFVAAPYYTGRYGEYRETDMVGLEETIKVDGEQVAGSYDEYQQLQGQWIGEGIPTGVFDISLTNKNVEVDGLDGKNEATIHFDMGAEDKEAPNLQMLWFKDKDNNIIDRFAKAEDGTLEFAGGDFNFHFVNEGSYWYDIAEQTVSVSYSPYCKDEWAALEVEEIPENYFAPAFGYFYRGSLKDVTGQAEKGWFDLKIRLEDKAGNWQEQVISPAFRIDDLVDTGISQLTNDNGQLTISGNETVYDVMGRRLANAQSSMSNGQSQKGIHIVRRADGDVRKVVVR